MPTHTRLVTPLLVILAATTLTAVIIAVMPRAAPPAMAFEESQAATTRALMTSVTPARLSAVIGQPYGLRFATTTAPEPAATGTATDRVEVSGTNLTGGGHLDVVVFGGLPGSVRAMACEVTRAEVQSAAAMLGACARVAAGDAGAPVVASWIRTELGGPAGDGDGTWSAVVGATHYALRAIPAGRSWTLSMSPDGS
ncbi:MAG TPA: hypothetical protein VFU73_00585 [Actinocrinis sp.]|nr:hypothetical protein [Actinocrinis sp.]